MYFKRPKGNLWILISVPLLLISAATFAQDEPGECVETGALAYDNWTKMDSGGDGSLPDGVQSADYIRCKACHGWDRRGTAGGYIRRSRKDTRPNAGAGDGDSTPRAIMTGTVTADQITHAGTGRSYADGQGSWVPLDDERSAANTAAHAGGYTLGNQHPDFSTGGMTQEQVDCLVEFLNFADGDPGMYFMDIDPSQNPVLYTIVGTADPSAGQAFFDSNCAGCHTLDFVLEYLEGDGKFSELAHKGRWGSPDTSMTRSSMGDPTSANIADLLLYLQDTGATGFAVNPGLTGTWWNSSRPGEGFLLEFADQPGQPDVLTMFASFYTYDNMGNQVWLTAQPTAPDLNAVGTTVEVTYFITDGAMWGADFDGNDVNLTEWGTGSLVFDSCSNGSVSLMPNQAMIDMGFTDLEYALTRDLLDSGIACPASTGN
jgi:mono/diheme cytochrome c family protein